MFIFIVAEMTSISVVYATMCNNFEKTPFMLSIILSLGIFTFFYTTLGGLPASIATDKFQGIIISILVVMLLISVTAVPENKITKEQFDKASNWTIDGFMVAVTLTIAILSAELFNQGTWQRVWAADSVSSMRKGFIIGSVLVFLLVFFFGVMGIIGYAKDSEFYDMGATFAFLSFFNILEPLSNFWHVMVLILVTALAASSVDSLQNAIACIFSSDFISLGWNPVLVSRILLVAVNVPAIFMSIQGYNVISLFLVADLVCATSVAPLFMGLQSNDIGMLPAPTELGALIGCIAGVVTVIVNGYVNKANGSGPFEYFWLRNNDQCSLCGSKTMITFIIVPIFSIVFTIIGSFIDIKLRGDRAREPLIMFSFDRHNENKEVSKTEKEDAPGVVSNDDTPNKANEVFDEEC
jgi:Na+/proline symporter